MGLLRFILALTVVIAHSEPLFGFVFTGAVVAVQAFFMISGFYMALILNEKYVGAGSYRLFITNRFLRLFPAYWVVLGLTVLMSAAYLVLFGEGWKLTSFLDYFGSMDIFSQLYILFTNIFMFGQDTIMFLKFNPAGALEFAENFRKVDSIFPPAYFFLFVPQAWSLGIELLFYILAPLLVRRRLALIAALITASLLLRAYIYSLGLTHDPWTYRFFPTEIVFFLLGIVAYRIYGILKNRKIQQGYYSLMLGLIIVLTFFYQFIPFAFKNWIYFFVLIFGIPAIFIYTKDKRLDNYIGELSYPIYISHLLVLNLTTYKFYTGGHSFLLHLFSIAMVILFSMLLVHLLIKPIERIRQSRVNNNLAFSQGAAN